MGGGSGKGRRWDVRREGFLHTVSGQGDYCFEERGRSRCGAEASPRQDGGWGAEGGRWVRGELSPSLGPGVGFPGVLGPRAAASKSLGSGLWATSSAAASARGGSRPPRSCGARAARSRERRGKQQAGRAGAGGSGSQGRGADPAWTCSARWRTHCPRPSASPRSGESPSHRTWPDTSPTTDPRSPRERPGRLEGVG